MVFGGVVQERYQLNDNTLWSGYPDPGNNPNAAELLPLLRQTIFEGKYDSADRIWKKMQGPYSAKYLPLADLWLQMNLPDSIGKDYYRDLDLTKAISTVRQIKTSFIDQIYPSWHPQLSTTSYLKFTATGV